MKRLSGYHVIKILDQDKQDIPLKIPRIQKVT